ncbi:TOX high mobility group box family member 2-like [Sinocyclocheilus rhinocerous]|uniref:TOX high mobility group box family member 2-like n=1 Tax=Sinocyclocheilus rhinocerous TaxID=307959 RepID=UPI0007B86345|nr:PREDICTED: TOX high mobility group box family member 2-like [Sinocyclocheilus rhinocerous]
MDPESGYLCPSIPHNGLINPYSYPELPALMMSNMLAQDGHLLSSHMPSMPVFAGQLGGHYPRAHHSPMLNPSARILPHPMSALSQLSSQIGQGSFTHGSPSSSGSQSATPSPSSSAQEEEAKYHSKTYSDPVESKSAQSSQASSHMMPPNAPLAMQRGLPDTSSPYLGPSPFPLSDLQSYAVGAPRHGLPRSAMLPALSASPPASFQISPPLHQQLSLHQGSLLNQPIRMQQVQSQPIISHQMGLQAPLHSPPPGQQGFSHLQSEYQKSVGGSQSPGAPNPAGQNPDWDSEYCNRECGGNHCSGSMIGRDKPLYLT